MVVPKYVIDIKESTLRRKGNLLNILLSDRTTGENIIWATDSYEQHGVEFAPENQMKPELTTINYGKLIQPRAAKTLEEQRQRTKYKAEVFTPLNIVNKINKSIDSCWDINKKNWQKYVRELKLEITCGEAPFIVSRYDPTAHTGKLIELEKRVGFLDRKLRVVSEFCNRQDEWLHWAKEAYKASYGYEWQGDNILIARENLLYSLIDYYMAKFNQEPSVPVLKEFAEIISWNIFQMDGLKCVVPMSCNPEKIQILGENTLFGETPDIEIMQTCEGCKTNQPTKHNGQYVQIMDWESKKPIYFVDLFSMNKTNEVRRKELAFA